MLTSNKTHKLVDFSQTRMKGALDQHRCKIVKCDSRDKIIKVTINALTGTVKTDVRGWTRLNRNY